MKSIELEFLMRDNLSPGLDKAGKAAENLGDKADKVSKSLTDRIAAQKEQIQYVEQSLVSLSKQYGKLGPSSKQVELRLEIEACNKALQEDKNILAALEAEHNTTAASSKKLTTQLRELQSAMAQMRLDGKKDSQAYQEMEARAAELADTIGDVRAQTNILAHDNAALQGVMSGANGLSGAFTMATGVMGVFASENENLVKLQARVQSAMAITMGLQQVMNTLNKDSAFRLVAVAKAKAILSAANYKLATALGISNAAATALMATLTLGLSVAITAAVVAIDKMNTRAAEAKKTQEELNKAMVEAAVKPIASFKELQATYNSLGDDLKKKQKFIEENKTKFDSLGVSVNGVADAESLLVENSSVFIESCMLKAKALATQSLAIEKYKDVLEAEQELENTPQHTRWERYLKKDENGVWQEEQVEVKEKPFEDAARKVEKKRKEYEKLISQQVKLSQQEQELINSIGLSSNVEKPNGTPLKNNLGELELKAQKKIEDARIALMKEGYEKERAEAKRQFDLEKDRIAQEEAERNALYDKLQAAGVKVTPEQRSNIGAQALHQRLISAQLYDAQIAGIDEKERAEAKERAQKTEDQLKTLLSKYSDYNAQRIALEGEYKTNMAELEAGRTSDNSSVIDAAISEATRQYKEALQAIQNSEANALSKDSPFLKNLFGDYAEMGHAKLKELTEQARVMREYLSGSTDGSGLSFISKEQLDIIAKSPAELDKLQKALDKLLDNGKYGDSAWGKIFNSFEVGLKKLKEANGFEETSAAIGGLAATASNAAGELSGMFAEMGNTHVAAALSGVEQAMGAISNIGEGFAKGGLVGGIAAAVGEAANIIGQVFAAEERHQAALEEIQRSKLDFQRQYNLLLLEQNLLMEDAESIFGERQITKAVGAIKNYAEALSQLKAEMQGDGAAPTMHWIESMTNDAWGTYAKRVAAYQDGIAKLSQQLIVTGHKKTGLFGWGKGKDVYGSILDEYPELIKANGELDTAMLQTILSTRQMSDETRAYLENLNELTEAMEAAEEALDSYLSSTFGSLGDGIMDSITSALQGSGTALENFAGEAASVIERLGEQLAYTLYFADKFDDLENSLKEIYSSGKTDEEIANEAAEAIGSFYSSIGGSLDDAQSWMEQWQAKAAEMGIDLWKSEGTTQSGRAGSFTTMSQDQGTKLEGLLTAAQMHLASIDNKVENLTEGLGGAIDHLRNIDENTAACSAQLREVRERLDQIIRDGVKAK